MKGFVSIAIRVLWGVRCTWYGGAVTYNHCVCNLVTCWPQSPVCRPFAVTRTSLIQLVPYCRRSACLHSASCLRAHVISRFWLAESCKISPPPSACAGQVKFMTLAALGGVTSHPVQFAHIVCAFVGFAYQVILAGWLFWCTVVCVALHTGTTIVFSRFTCTLHCIVKLYNPAGTMLLTMVVAVELQCGLTKARNHSIAVDRVCYYRAVWLPAMLLSRGSKNMQPDSHH